jgi:hypothetical protein
VREKEGPVVFIPVQRKKSVETSEPSGPVDLEERSLSKSRANIHF